MLGFWTRRKMSGGLYFGPAGWIARRWAEPRRAAARLLVPVPSADRARASGVVGRIVSRGDVLLPAGDPLAVDLLAPCAGSVRQLVVQEESTEPRVFLELIPLDAASMSAASEPSEAATDKAPPAEPPRPTSASELREVLRGAGIGRTSAWTPSLLEQLTALAGERPRWLIINMVTPLPESALPQSLWTLDMPRMLAGVSLLRHAVQARRTLVVVDRHGWRRRWRRALRRDGVPVRALLNRYPQAQPTVLLRRLLGEILPVDSLPTHVRVVLADPVSIWALGGLAIGAGPFLERPVELFSGDEMPRLARVPLGSVVSDLLEQHNLPGTDRQCIVGGMLTGREIDPATTVISGSSEAVAVRTWPWVEVPTPCIQCGWCVDHCPTDLQPVRLYHLAQAERRSEAAREALHCVGCGLCSYVCPTRLPLTEQILELRTALRHAAAPETTTAEAQP